MIAGIVGLGLIGGSLAKAYKSKGQTVYALDTDKKVFDFAKISGVVDDELNDKNLKKCDVLFIAVFPQATIDYLKKNADKFPKKCVVIDCCGIKREVCKVGFNLAEKYGFTFVGGHPMAGSHKGGFKNARENLFSNAPMVIIPPKYDDIALLDRVKNLIAPADFGKISVTTAEDHDEIIAFTSQMAHVVSNAFIKSPTALKHKGFSAGSYKDLTRVANLNPKMWSELFLHNKDFLLNEIDTFINEMEKYRDAIKKGDESTLESLLLDGTNKKKEADKR
jgi:prephenate dehydrogenase